MLIKKYKIGLVVALNLILTSIPLSAKAVQFPDGRTAFNKSPLLLNVITTFNEVAVWSAKYYFTINLPENAGEPLGQVKIQQREGFETILFYLDKTFAFEGTPNQRGKSLSIKEVKLDENSNTVTVIFDPPIPPGTVFTLGLKPQRNPLYDGIYLFGVTALPVGEQPSGLYLGVGRLQFYRGGYGLW